MMTNEEELVILDRLKNTLQKSNINYEEFCNLLINNNAFISGSFLLQIIQNKFFNDNDYDIDIYTIGKKNKILETNIKNIIEKQISENLLKENFLGFYIPIIQYRKKTIYNKYKNISNCVLNELYFNNTNTNTNSHYYCDIENIRKIIDFETLGTIIKTYQLIYFKEDKYNTYKEIVDNFDFDFCANYFDGKNIYSPYKIKVDFFCYFIFIFIILLYNKN